MYIDDCVQGTQAHHAQRRPSSRSTSAAASSSRSTSSSTSSRRSPACKLERRYDLDAPKGVSGRNSDNTLIQQDARLGALHPLRDGLEQTYRWIYDELKSGRSKDAPVNRT